MSNCRGYTVLHCHPLPNFPCNQSHVAISEDIQYPIRQLSCELGIKYSVANTHGEPQTSRELVIMNWEPDGRVVLIVD